MKPSSTKILHVLHVARGYRVKLQHHEYTELNDVRQIIGASVSKPHTSD